MMRLRRMYKWNRAYWGVALACWLVYAGLTMFEPVRTNPYHLTRPELVALQLTIVIPILVIWLVAMNGVARFRHYAHIIRRSDDGRALNQISLGLLLVALCFILQGLVGAVPVYLMGTKYENAAVVVTNHAPMLLALAAYGVIFAGALKLRSLSVRRLTIGGLATILFPYCLLAVIYGVYFYHHLPQPMVNGVSKFAMPGKWPFFTLALPYIVTWLMGILAVTIIAEYARTVGGSIYRRALRDLVRGVSAALVYSILIQLLQLSSRFFAKLTLGPVLVLVYAIVVLYSLGFVFIARGARKLMLIEESL